MYSWIIYLHILATFTFLLVHGASTLVAFRLRTERDLERIRALFELYLTNGAMNLMWASLLVLLVSGIAAGFLGRWWGTGWIWTSLGLLVAILVGMFILGSNYYHRVRKAVGMAYMEGSKQMPAVEPASAEEIEALLSRSPAVSLAAIGFGGIAVILWLMMFKPF